MQKIRNEAFDHNRLLWIFGTALIVIASASRALRMYYHSSGGHEGQPDWIALLFSTIFFAATYLLTLWLGAILVSRLASYFSSTAGLPVIRSVIILAYTPVWLAQPVMLLSPLLRFLGMAAFFYSAVLLGVGMRYAGKTPNDRLLGFTLASLFIIVGISYVLNALILGSRLYHP